MFRKSKPRNYVGLYIQPKDIQRYIYDYTNYGIDYSGDDNDCAEDRWESMMNEPGEERYWDENNNIFFIRKHFGNKSSLG